MGIAMLTLSGLFQGFSALQCLTAGAQPTPSPRAARALRMVRPTGMRAPVSARPVSSIRTPRPSTLRVLSVSDAAHTPGDVGRMRISGRMADVCAELDRLAAREAAATRH